MTLSPSGSLAWNTGRTVHARDDKGRVTSLDLASTPQGLVFAPKGYRLAIGQMNGVSLWYPATQTKPEFLDWKGSHLDVVWSPDGRFVVSSMQENALHGWRLGEKPSHMRMTGYPAKPRSLSWSHDGLWLASSGADAAIVWPFQGDGPQGKAPRECGARHAKVTRVAFHPKALVLAVGYDDGCILMIRLTDASELLVRPALRGSGITAFAWDKGGKRLAFGTEDGAAGVLTLPTPRLRRCASGSSARVAPTRAKRRHRPTASRRCCGRSRTCRRLPRSRSTRSSAPTPPAPAPRR